MTLQVTTAATGVARTAHYVIPTGQTQAIPTLLLEPQRTNLCIRSEEFDTWTQVSQSVTANTTTAPDGTVTADTLTASATAGYSERICTFTGDGTKAISVYFKRGTASQTSFGLRDVTAGAWRYLVSIDWTGTVPSFNATVSGAGTQYPIESFRDGWYRILLACDGIVAANSNRIRIYADQAAGVGTTIAWGAQAENAVVPSSYIKTEGSTVTRNADSLYFPFTAAPQAMTVYVRGVELSNPSGTGKAETALLSITAASLTDPSFGISKPTSANYAAFHDPATLTSASVSAAAIVRNDLVEIRARLLGTGAAAISLTQNGGTETNSVTSTPQALAAAWSDQRVNLNSYGISSAFGQFGFTHVAIAQGEQSRDTMRQLAGVV